MVADRQYFLLNIVYAYIGVCILEDQTDNLVQCMTSCCLQKVLQFGDPLSEAILQYQLGIANCYVLLLLIFWLNTDPIKEV